MTFATQRVQASVTYTESAPVTPGSGSSPFKYWVIDGTTTVENTAADARVAEQFKAMVTAGRAYAITAHSLVESRSYTPLVP